MFPSIERDWTLPWNQNVPIETFFVALQQESIPLLEKVILLDIYEKSLQEKNVTFRFIYRDKNKTLTFEEIEKEHSKITERVEKYLKTIVS
jgi:phenylalanyl-tRNA synthetase beta chain